jgi:hypothetical protein
MSSVEHGAAVQKQLTDDKTRLCLLTDELFEQVPGPTLLVDKASRAMPVKRKSFAERRCRSLFPRSSARKPSALRIG